MNCETMSDDTNTNRRQVLNATDDNPVVRGGSPDRRGVLRGTLAAAGAALGLPVLGSSGARASESWFDYHAQPENVREAVDAKIELFEVMKEIGAHEGARSGGLQVVAREYDGQLVPEQRLYLHTDFADLTVVLSPEDAIGGETHVVTDSERMDYAPFEWPLDEVNELPDGRLLFRIDDDGWADPMSGFEMYDEVPPSLRCDERCTWTQLPGTDCEYVRCCGHFEARCADNKNYTSCNEESICNIKCWNLGGNCSCLRHDYAFCN